MAYKFFNDVVAKEILVKHELNKHGGSYKLLEKIRRGGVGLGGFKYINGVPEVDKRRKYTDTIVVNFEWLRNGFVIRFRNVEFHSMVLCKLDAIHKIELQKDYDVIQFSKRSLFRFFYNRGLNYESARMFGTPKELRRIGKIVLKITIGEHEMVFQNMEGFTEKSSKFFKESPVNNRYLEDLNAYKIIS